MTKQRLDVRSAAEVLGISVDAISMRARRGTLDSEHDDGRLYVWVNADETTDETTVRDELVEELRDRIGYLEEESRRKDHLLAAALERTPAIEAPVSPEPAESPETPAEGTDKGKRTTRNRAALLVAALVR